MILRHVKVDGVRIKYSVLSTSSTAFSPCLSNSGTSLQGMVWKFMHFYTIFISVVVLLQAFWELWK